MSGKPQPTPPERYHFLTPVWNRKYVELFLEYVLPSQMTSGNLRAMPAEKCLYQICTRREDARHMQDSPIFSRLRDLIPVSFQFIDDLDLKCPPYVPMTRCYERGLGHSAGIDTAFIFLTPDSFWNDGAFRNLDRRLREGKRAVVTVGLRARLEEVLRHIDRHWLDRANGSAPLPAREMVRLALENLHPMSAAHIVEDGSNRSLGHYYWRVGNHGLVARCFHIHPLMIRPLTSERRLFTTLDHDFVRLACPSYDDVHVVTDSDEICGVEVSENHHLASMVAEKRITEAELQEWMDLWTNSFHRRYFTEPICLHAGDVTQDYAPVTAEADALVNRVMKDFEIRCPDPEDGMPVLLGKSLRTQPDQSTRDEPALPVKRSLGQRLRGGLEAIVRRAYRAILWRLYARLDHLENRLDNLEMVLHQQREMRAYERAVQRQEWFAFRKELLTGARGARPRDEKGAA